MARPKIQSHKAQRAPAAGRDSKFSAYETSRQVTSTKLRGDAAIQRPMKEPAAAQKVPKIRHTVSVAGVFKKAKVENTGRKQHKRKTSTPEPTPEPDLADDFKNGLDEARNTIDNNLGSSFTEVQGALLAKLRSARVKDEAFLKSISTMAEMLGASLTEEQIETTFTRDGKRVTEIVDIGKRIVQFKKSVDKESGKLEEYWRQWADLQNEYVELGVEVLGPKLFQNHEVESIEVDKGFKKAMELLDLEHTSKVEELTAEVDDITSKIIKKMKASEKELDANAKKEQARLLQAIIQD